MDSCCAEVEKTLIVDFLYLDLSACERCQVTNSSLKEALQALSGVFDTLGYTVNVNEVNITSRELAEQYRFVSSPTIRVNGVNICTELLESDCSDCGDLCGDSVDCRVFVYEGSKYEQPPAAVIVDGILRTLFGNLTLLPPGIDPATATIMYYSISLEVSEKQCCFCKRLIRSLSTKPIHAMRGAANEPGMLLYEKQ